MTSVSRALSSLLVGAACMTGMVACGDSNKVSDQSFVDQCKDGVDSNATAKAYSTDICKCAQDKLKSEGLGDKTPDDKGAQEAATKAIAACTTQAITGQ